MVLFTYIKANFVQALYYVVNYIVKFDAAFYKGTAAAREIRLAFQQFVYCLLPLLVFSEVGICGGFYQ